MNEARLEKLRKNLAEIRRYCNIVEERLYPIYSNADSLESKIGDEEELIDNFLEMVEQANIIHSSLKELAKPVMDMKSILTKIGKEDIEGILKENK